MGRKMNHSARMAAFPPCVRPSGPQLGEGLFRRYDRTAGFESAERCLPLSCAHQGGTADGKPQPTGASEMATDRMPTPADFEITDAPLPDAGDGEVLVRGIYLSLDPYMRGRISGQRSYARPVEVGAVIEGRVVGEVARSRDPGFREGDYVLGGFGWQLYSAVPGQGLLKLDPATAPL